ncbi:tandem-95 repeat protein, partial [Leucobacter sp. USCH14]|uniref:Ig-like domain-containing protein n=1 Tax=Leucobacter sp. USCH14 TaxID=3024838 RepID=UPI00309B8C17
MQQDTKRDGGRSSFVTFLSGIASAAIAVSGLVLGVPSAAQAAPPFEPGLLYGTQAAPAGSPAGTQGSRTIVAVNPATRAVTNSVTAPGSTTLNQLGVSVDGRFLMVTNPTTVYRYSTDTEQWASVARPSPSTVANTMGGVDPRTGYLFYGGQVSGTNNFTFSRYNPATNTLIPGIVTVTAPNPPGGNGDLVFDRLGNMYFVAAATSATPGGQIYRADVEGLDAGTATAVPIGANIDVGGVNSISFGADGYLYLFGTGTFFKVSPITGDRVEQGALSPVTPLTDLGSRATPRTIDLASSGAAPDAPFDVAIGGPGISVGNTGTADPDGTADVGPIIVLPNETYTVTQTPKPGNIAIYDTTWTCTDVVSNAVVQSGEGNNGSFVFPANSPGVSCSFTNVEQIQTGADESTNNPQGETVTVPVLGNDRGSVDPASLRIVDGDELVTSLTVAGQGVWTVDTVNGTISFAPEAGYSGNPTPITYQVADADGETSRNSVSVTFAPAAANDESLRNEQGATVTVPVLANDLGELDAGSVRLVDGDQLVTELVVAGQGTWTVNPETGAVSFAPEEGFSGNPTPVTYQVTDAEGETSRAEVTVTYASASANDQSLNNAQGETVTVPVLANDLGALDPASVRIADGDARVTELVVDGEGTWTVDPETGAISFAPAEGFSGNPAPIAYEVTDADGETSGATVTVTYAPTAVAYESLNNPQGETVSVPVLANDLGALDPASVRIIDGEELVTELVVDGQGTWTVDPETGAISFAPAEGFSGNPTPITYQATDAEGETTEAGVTVTYAPEAVTDESLNNAQGATVEVPVLDNDLGDFDPASVRIANGEDVATQLVVDGEGTWTVDPETGAISFAPAEGFSGNPTPIVYQATDTEGQTVASVITVTYAPAAAADESLNNAQGETVSVPVLANDLGALDPASVRILSGDELVTELVVDGQGTWTVDPETGVISFAPEEGFSGNPAPITYRVTDSEGETSEAEVTVTYAPAAANDESLNNAQGATVSVPVLANDLGALVPASVRIVDGENRVVQLEVEGQGTWSVNPINGVIVFAPEDGFSGNPTPIAYEVTDVEDQTSSATVTVTYAPAAANDESLNNAQGTPVSVPVLANDLGALDPASLRILDGEELVMELVVDGEGTWTVDPETGAISFAPEEGFSGNPAPITYQVTDTEGESSEAEVTVTYAPAAADDESLNNAQGATVSVPVLANDLGALDPASVRIVDGEELVMELVVDGEGTWTVDPETGAISFAPEEGFSGNPAPITYQVTDDEGETSTATVTVTYVPEATNDESLNNAQGATVSVPVLANDLGALDPASVRIVDGEELLTELVVEGEGTWTVDPETGAISFAPEEGFSGNPAPITYQVTDDEGETSTAT